MNLFQYFDASHAATYECSDRKRCYINRPDLGGIQEIPYDLSYKRFISKSWYE